MQVDFLPPPCVSLYADAYAGGESLYKVRAIFSMVSPCSVPTSTNNIANSATFFAAIVVTMSID